MLLQLLALGSFVRPPVASSPSQRSHASQRMVRATAAMQAVATKLDVVELTKEFLATSTGYYSPVDPERLDPDFVFRAPTIGPLNKMDYINTMTTLHSQAIPGN